MLNRILLSAPKLRFDKGWNTLGAVKHPKDQRNVSELVTTIEYLSHKAGLRQPIDLKNIDPKHLPLFADTLEIATTKMMNLKDINLNKKLPDGKTLLENLLDKMAKASKNRHKAMDFTYDVINNSDIVASKRFLEELSKSDVLDISKSSEKFQAARAMVPDIAESTLKPPYLFNKSLDNFMFFIKTLVSPKSKIDKVEMIKGFGDTVNKAFTKDKSIDVVKFVTSDAPQQKVAENIKVLEQLAPLWEKQNSNVDITDFVLKNTNLQ